jgi:hypothetical protein
MRAALGLITACTMLVGCAAAEDPVDAYILNNSSIRVRVRASDDNYAGQWLEVPAHLSGTVYSEYDDGPVGDSRNDGTLRRLTIVDESCNVLGNVENNRLPITVTVNADLTVDLSDATTNAPSGVTLTPKDQCAE